MIEKKNWIRACSDCGKELQYSNVDSLKKANRNNSACRSCAKIGSKHHMWGITLSETHKKAILKANIGRKCSDETKRKIGKANSGDNNGMKQPEARKKVSDYRKGKTLSTETKRKLRLSIINQIEQRKLNGGQMKPNYNINSISILEQTAKDLGIVDLQHAENGGEFYIKELGFWVDGYSKEKNIVIEYDERHHFNDDGTLNEKDIKRQDEIQKYLNCEFIRISE